MSGFMAAKLGAQIVGGLGVTKILAGIIQNNVPVVTTAQKVLVNAGAFVLGSMLVEQSSSYIERTANELKNSIKIERNKTEDKAEQ